MKFLPRFSVENPVLVNVIMLTIIVSGVYAGLTLVREMFPESRPLMVVITAPYPGATPAEVEKGVALRLEEAIKDVEHIDKIVTDISEGLCTIRAEMDSDLPDIDQAVNDFKAAIDAIPQDELPEELEEIRVAKFEPRLPVISVTIYGDVDEATRKALGQRLRDELLLLPEVSDIDLDGVRKAELTVEVAPEKLVEYGVSLAQVASAIRQANLDLPAGRVKTARQNVLVRTLGETDDVDRIAQTIVRTTPEGKLVRVADLGRVIDGFADEDSGGMFNGKPAVSATIYKTGDQDAVRIAGLVKAFAAGKARRPVEWDWLTRLKNGCGVVTEAQRVYQQAYNDPYPANVTIRTHSNLARFIESRLDLLKRNGIWGLCLVFLSLLVFLNGRVAFWVVMGLLVSVCGAVLLMKVLGATLNLITMFGLIVVLGLIVDDAIVVGENVYARVERGEDPRSAAVAGTQQVTWPVVVAVTTTIGAFMPLLFIEGRIGDFMGVLPLVVMCALSVSLLEAFVILPAHLAESLGGRRRKRQSTAPDAEVRRDEAPVPSAQTAPAAATGPGTGRLVRGGRWLVGLLKRSAGPVGPAGRSGLLGPLLQNGLARHYERLLRLAVRYRYVTVAAVTAALLICGGLVLGRHVPFVFVQKMDSETVMIDLDMPVGTPVERTRETLEQIQDACLALPETDNVWAIVGARIGADEHGLYTTLRSHLAQLIIELKPVEQRERSSDEVIAELRARTSNLAGVDSLRFRAMHGGPAGSEIEIEVTGERMEPILAATELLKDELARYRGVHDIADDYEEGQPEVRVELLDSARPLGLTTRALATEVRGAFFGLEARTIQRRREDVDIRVRFPEVRRRHIHELETMRVVTPAGAAVPLCEVARLSEGRGSAALRRVDQRRAVVVTADVDQTQANAEEIIASLRPTIAELERQFPGLRLEFTGNKRETMRSLGSLRRDFLIALLLIYFMLAGLFKSYIQPLVVLTAVPFGINGAVAGHLIMGYPLTILSAIGLVALTGIVVNDALILVDFINKEARAGTPLTEAVVNAGRRRLRPIILTSLTTILGLAPLMTETSFQARFLIPLAISISFGLAFATVLTLIVVPANYMIVADLKRLARRVWFGPRQRPTAPQPA